MPVGFLPRSLAVVLVVCSFLVGQQNTAKPQKPEEPAAQEVPSQAESGPSSNEDKKATPAQESVTPVNRALPENPEQQAWDLLEKASHSDKASERITSVDSLSLVSDNPRALKLAEAALLDDKAEVRVAAATTLGELRYKSSIPKLRSMLEDKEPAVVLAAAHALEQMKDESAYEVYYEILTGERKASKGLVATETSILHDPKKLAKLGIEEGISNVVPFGGFGVAAYRMMSKNEGARIRAAAAKALTDDPDPSSTKALVNATGDNDWTVRASALEALSKRGDASVLKTVELYMYDDKSEVKYNAAAATLHLLAVHEKRHPDKAESRKRKTSSPRR
jgi:HEAT repeat protein